MMQKYNLSFLGKAAFAAAFLLLPVRAVIAQESADSIPVQEDVISQDDDNSNDGTFKGDIKDVYLQTRYRPRENDSLFYRLPKWRRMYFGIGGGFHNVYDNVSNKFSGDFQAYVGYSFTPIHSLRFEVTGIFYRPDGMDGSKTKVGLEADYVANLSNFARGYNPTRIFDVSTVLGAGVQVGGSPLGSAAIPFGKFGIHMNLHTSSNASFYIEPYVGIQKGMDELFARANPSKWNVMYGVNGGLDVNLLGRYRGIMNDSTFYHGFFDSSFGWTFQPRGGQGFHTSGTAYQIAFGTWLNPFLGLRAGISAQEFVYNSTANVTTYGYPMRYSAERFLVSGRAELMMDPLNLSRRWREKQGGHAFDLNILAGGEYGFMMKGANQDYLTEKHTGSYFGATGALQFMYRINNPGTFIFLEPRYMAAFYNDNKLDGTKEDPEHTFSIGIGTRIYLNRYAPKTAAGYEFKRHWWAAFDFGGVKWERVSFLTKGGAGFNPSFSFSLGYDLAKMASFRAQINYQKMSLAQYDDFSALTSTGSINGSALFQNKYTVLDFRLAYMLNLNTLFQGYDAGRKYSLWYTVGPALTWISSQQSSLIDDNASLSGVRDLSLSNSRKGNISPAIYTSLMAALRVAPNLDVTAEVGGQYNFVRWTDPGDHGSLNNVKYYATVGTRYHFMPGMFKHTVDQEYDNLWFFDSSFGYSVPQFEHMFQLSGTSYQMSIGKWITPIWGLRGGISAKTNYWKQDKVEVNGKSYWNRREQAIVNARLEFLLNPMNFVGKWRNKEGGHDFDLNLAAGLDLGYNEKALGEKWDENNGRFHFMYGFTGAAQFMYRINNPGTYIFFEPRIQTLKNTSPYTGFDEGYVNNNETNYTFSIGTRVYMFKKSLRTPSPEEFMKHWWVAFDFGGVKWNQNYSVHTKGLGLNPQIDLSVGYDFHPYATLRAQIGYERMNIINIENLEQEKYNTYDLRLQYMLNINTLMQGYNSARRYNLYWTAGPTLTFIGKYGEARSTHFSPGISTSLMSALRVAPQVDVTAEVMGQYNFNAGTNPGYMHRRLNNVKYSFVVGTRYHIQPRSVSPAGGSEYESRWFFDASLGMNSPTLKNKLHDVGLSYQIAVGKWFNPVLGARLGISATNNYWRLTDTGNNTARNSQAHITGRFEMLLNPLNMSRPWREKDGGHDFDFNLLAGVDLGANVKSQGLGEHSDDMNVRMMYGLTTAMQFMYRINNPGTYIYFEPRYAHVSNYNPNGGLGEWEGGAHKYTFSVGTRIYMYKKSERLPSPEEFKPHMWTGIAFGGAKWNHPSTNMPSGAGFNPHLDFSVGYDYKPLASFRAQIGWEQLRLNGATSGTTHSYDNVDVRLAYMLNINNLLQGYNSARRFNFFWTGGPAITFVSGQNSKVSVSPALNTSLLATYRVAKNVDVDVEAMGQWNALNSATPEILTRWSKIKYAVTAGTRYHFTDKSETTSGNKDYTTGRFFFDSSLGWHVPTGGNFLHSAGISYQMGIGKWINPYIGLHLGLSATNNYWHTSQIASTGQKMRSAQANISGRLELLINPMNFSSTWRNKDDGHDFDLNLLFGGDLGMNVKALGINQHTNKAATRTTYGFTTAAQFMYRINKPGTYIYFEPRYTRYSNSSYNNGIADGSFASSEDNYQFSIGSRIYFYKKSERTVSPEEFQKHWWAGLSFGGARWNYTTTIQGNGFNPHLDFSVGYDYKPLASFRLQLGWERYGYTNINTLQKEPFNVVDLRLGYMLNINNLLQGYNSARKFNYYWTAGPAVSFVTSDYTSKRVHVTPAINTSLMATMKVARNVDVDVEAMGQLNFLTSAAPNIVTQLSKIKYSVTIGTRYHFNQDQIKGAFEDLQRHSWEKGWGFEASLGWNIPVGTPNGAGHASGTNLTVSADHMFNALLGMRLGINGRYGYWANTSQEAVVQDGEQIHEAYTQYLGEYQIGARAEVLINPLSLMTSRKGLKEAPKWDMNLALGLDLGMAHKAHNYSGSSRVRALVGFTVAAQALYRLNEVSQLYIEPRYSIAGAGIDNNYLGASSQDKFFTLSVGTRISRPMPKKNEKVTPDMLSHRGWWAQFEAGIAKHTQDFRTVIGGTSPFQPNIAISGAYDFTRLHTARVRLDWYRNSSNITDQSFSSVAADGIRYNHEGTVKANHSIMDLQFMYMLNLTNLWTGLDRQNKFTVYWEAGAGMAACVASSAKLHSGEKTYGTDVQVNTGSYAGKVSPAMLTGIMMGLKVAKHLDVTAEVIGQYDFNHQKLMLQQCPRYINGIKLDVSAGLRYRF